MHCGRIKLKLLTMFQLQGVVFIAVLCAVNAAVTVNIYKDDLETVEVKVHEVKSCDAAWCERTCRLLGFTSGICAGDTCRCFNHKEGDLETVEVKVHEVKSCDAAWCERTCRLLGFTSGICAGDTCRCFNHKDEQIEQNDIPSVDEDVRGNGLSGCDPNACDQLCRRLKFASGTCINGRCKCDNFRREPELEIFWDQGVKDTIGNSVESNYVHKVVTMAIKDCDQLACMMGCQELGFPGGSCFLGKCRCNKRGKEEENKRSLNSVTENCNSVTCNMMCLRLKYHGGWCRFDTCECF